MSFFNELKRRNVIRVGIAYAVASWVLLQVVDLVFEYITAPAWIMQVFMLALALGLPLVLILAWVFELTPEGIKRETAIDPAQSVAPQTGRKLDRVIIIFLALAVAFLLADRFRSGSDAVPGSAETTQVAANATAENSQPESAGEIGESSNDADKSIAVLPLANRSIQPEDAFFAEGLHDELLTQLSRISALRVISRTSVMGYAGTTKRIPDIGRELGVSTLLEGGVQRSGNRVRINVQLIEAATDEHLWAEVYDRELTTDNLFEIQSDITRAIANALQAVLTGEEQQAIEQKSTDNVEAYAYYLRGRALSRGFGRQLDDIDRSIAIYQAAIDLDPKFSAAYAALAVDWTERYWGTDKLGNELMHALEALQHARSLAPESPETLTAEGYYHYWGYLDYAQAIVAFDSALAKEPGNILALRGEAYVLRRMGRFDESIAMMQKVISMDPLDVEMPADVGYTLLRNGQFTLAKVMMNRSVTLDPEREFSRYTLAEALVVEGDLEGAWQIMGPGDSEAEAYNDDLRLLVARAQANNARIDETLEYYQSTQTSNSFGPDFARALVYLDRGEQSALNALLADLQTSAQKAERERPGEEATLVTLISLYALQKDQANLSKTIAVFYATVKPDALRIAENRVIPIAYAIAGDTEAALDYMEQLLEQYGPWEFYYFAINPSFNNMRDLPRFQAMDKRYRQWLAQLK
ncbi:MAG TPA: tetratricopeptide repeat protein [Xanthomonadales bacterium]